MPESLDYSIRDPIQDLYRAYRESVVRQISQPESLDVFRPFVGLLKTVEGAAFYIEIAFFLALTACLLFGSLACLRLPGLVALLFFLAPAGNAMTIALIHALDNSRYRGSYGPLLLFALASMFLFALTASAWSATRISRGDRADEARAN